MKNLFFIFSFILSSSSLFACDDSVKPFPEKCNMQDHYQSLVYEFNKLSINLTDLKGFKIPKAIGKTLYNANQNELLNNTASTLSRYHQWFVWNNGQDFIKNLSPVLIESSDILKLHKALFFDSSSTESNEDLGKLRAGGGLTDPKLTFACVDKILNDKLFDLLSQYDLKNTEDLPLLRITNVQSCDDPNFSSGELYFSKSEGVSLEFNRWTLNFNNMLASYENMNSKNEISSLDYLAGMKRWFLALRPFNRGNEEVVSALIDYATRRLHLSPFPSNDSNLAIFLSVSENQDQSAASMNNSLSFFDTCLSEIKLNNASPECSVLK